MKKDLLEASKEAVPVGPPKSKQIFKCTCCDAFAKLPTMCKRCQTCQKCCVCNWKPDEEVKRVGEQDSD